MDVQQTMRTLMDLPPRKSVLIESRHGMGKSQVVAQAAAAMSRRLQKPFGFVDLRLGQYEIGDLIGIPRRRSSFIITSKVFKDGVCTDEETTTQNVTVHDLPLWFPRDPASCGILFFDEINRGSRETQQWAFQAVLDYRINFTDIPEGWRVVAACNDNLDNYNVLTLDPALYDRFLVVKFRPTVHEWRAWADSAGVHRAVAKYLEKFPGDLDPPEILEPGRRYPSRRSWANFGETLAYMAANGNNPFRDHDYLVMLALGYVGEGVAMNFVEFVKHDFVVHRPEDILENFGKVRNAFSKMPVNEVTFYNRELALYIGSSGGQLSRAYAENLYSYLTTIPRETAAGLWSELLKTCRATAINWYKSDGRVMGYLQEILTRSRLPEEVESVV